MRSSRTLCPRAGFLAAVIVCHGAGARGDMPEGKMVQDLTVGANHDIALKNGQVVQILKRSGDKTVITLTLSDGSTGFFQIDSTAIQDVPPGTPLGLPPPPPPPPAAPGTVPPEYPPGFAGLPTFQTTQGAHGAGVASLIKLGTGNVAYLVTARQLLGPHGGFATQIAAKDLPKVVTDVDLAPFPGGTATYAVTALPVKAGRLMADGGKPVDDTAIFRLQDTSALAQAVPIADQAPVIGDVIWVIARLPGEPEGQFAHRAQITGSGVWLEMQFDDDSIHTSGSIGAPVLNTSGQFVGVLSTSASGGGHERGNIIPAKLIAQIIAKQKH